MYIKNYKFFLKENTDQAKSILNKYKDAHTLKLDNFEKLKTLLASNLSYFGKFAEFLIHENVPFTELEKLYAELIYLKSKNHNLDISKLNYEKTLDEIQKAKNMVLVNSLVSQFPSLQKKFIRDEIKDPDDNKIDYETVNILLKVAEKPNLNAFISKISRYKESHELMQALKIFSRNLNNNKENVIEEISKMKDSSVVINNGNTLIVKVGSYNDIKVLGADTSWCIVSSEHQFYSYVSSTRSQFILYDYNIDDCDPKFKIGFTVNRDMTIYAAHDILDRGMSGQIVGILSDKGYKISDLFPKRNPVVIDINKIRYSTRNGDLMQFAEECDIKEIPKILNIIISLRKSDEFKRKICTVLCQRYFGVSNYFINENEIHKLNKALLKYLGYQFLNSRILYNNSRDFKLGSNRSDEIILKNLEILTDIEFAKLSYDKGIFNEICMGSKYEHKLDFNKQLATYISDRLNKIYKDNVIKFSDFGIKNIAFKGIKLTDNFEKCMLLFNAVLGRDKITPDYNKIINNFDTRERCDYVEIIKLPIDLSIDPPHSLYKEIIPYVIKKDYGETFYIATGWNSVKDSIDNYCKLVEHLQGHKIIFRITKKSVKFFYKSHLVSEHNVIIDLIKKFKITNLVKGTIVTDGTVSLKLEM